MPKQVKEMQPIEVKRLTRPGSYAVGGVSGLQLRVQDTGARSWVLRTKVGNKRREIGVGPYPEVSLATARQDAAELKRQIRQGTDPVLERRKLVVALKAEQDTRKTFSEVWREFEPAKLVGVTVKTRQHWQNTINRYALPVIGKLYVADIEMRHIQDTLAPVWTHKPMIAKKLRQRIERVLGYATAMNYRSGDNPARWKDNLDQVMAAPSEVHKTKHHRALSLDDTPAFIAELRKREGTAARALEFTILTACRSGEVRGALWSEIDIKRRRWTIPAERMKMDRDHVVVLSDGAVALLEALPRDSELVFPAPRGGMLSDMSLLAVIKRMGDHDRTTVHGFRSVFKVYADEETDIQDFISEIALAHYVSDDVMKAYKRSDVAAKRLKLMRQWSQFLGYREGGAKLVHLEARR